MFIKESGQPNVTVIGGGFDAWKGAGNKVVAGALPTAGRLRTEAASGIDSERGVCQALATATPADVLILDVRNADEANAGMIKGALLIPDEELASPASCELPKGKRIITHCSTGVRAEMAYHKLKQAGYNAGFVKGDIEIDKAGKLTITPN